MIKPAQIGKRLIGPGKPCFIIAEAGVNHNGDMQMAHRLIDAAARAGADAIKFQSFVTEELITPEAPKAGYQVETTGEEGSQYKMLKSLELSNDQQAELKEYCGKVGILYLCTPYEHTSVDMLDHMDIAAFKIASTDITNIPFLRYIASKGRPVILSTGMSTIGEVEVAVNTLTIGGLSGKIIILHCTAEYPAPISEVNLRAILTMQQAFTCPVGFSDHTSGIGASPWAVAVGACVIEKHFTLARDMVGPDHRASLEPGELADLVRTVRDVEAALGDGIKRPMPSELPNKPHMQKSLVARRSILAGGTITPDDLACKRPGFGLSPSWFDRVVGKRAAVYIPKDRILTLSSVDWSESRAECARQPQ
jgi:N-acetylneuraminate synthase